jgi:hypothetical protein
MDITVNIETLTLGELAAAEQSSGMSYQAMLKGRATMLLLALFVHELRSSEKPRSWQELSSLKVLDALSLMQRSSSDGAQAKSSV